MTPLLAGPTDSPSSLEPAGSVTRCELAIVAAIMVAALALRVWWISTAGLEHFDEGVYALSGLGLADEAQPLRLYPGQALFSPLVYPLLVALSIQAFGGPSDTAAILPNVVLGTVSVLLLWWVGRRWFGPVAGLVAATLLATSELHIAMSRSALTDVSFTLFFLAALACFVEARERDSLGWALLAGLATGLAWNTKYHGWFALIPTGAALLIVSLRNRSIPRPRSLGLWATSMGVAVVAYLPWAVFVNSGPGGYVGLVAYQRSMLQGTWLQNLGEQVGQLAYMDGAVSRVGFVVAMLIPFALTRGRPRLSRSSCLLILAGLALTLLAGAVGAATAVTLAWLSGLLRRPLRYAAIVLACWVVLWLGVAPLYTPYLRLLLPFTVAVFAGAGAWLQTVAERERPPRSHASRVPVVLVSASVAIAVLAAVLGMRNPVNPWRPTSGFREAAEQITEVVPEKDRVIVVGHPELVFYLHIAGRQSPWRSPAPEAWAAETSPVYLVEGVYARRAPKLRDGLARLAGRLELLATYPVVPKDLRVLDDFQGRHGRRYRKAPDGTFNLNLYVLHPAGS